VFGAGNIALHALELDFVEQLTRGELRLPWHMASKAIAAVDEHGTATTLTGFKFETFVFDALAFVERSVTLEVERAHEFSPVKNKTGEDSPATARAAQSRLHADWVRRAGRPAPPVDVQGVPQVEIDPVLAEDAETFALRAPARPLETTRGHFWS
jgi:UDP-N-acetylglucosamine/UDP-N-acetylgalactosamine diphosphorylase